MAEIEISLQAQKNIELELGEKVMHNQLKNLGFEESGHTGFQKELSPEMLEQISNIAKKEDRSNKINNWDELGDDTEGVVKYPTVHLMMELIGSVEENTKWHTEYMVGNVAQRVTNVENAVGEFETALDTAIALCDGYISGGAV